MKLAQAKRIVNRLKCKCFDVTGSVLREEPEVTDIDLLMYESNFNEFTEYLPKNAIILSKTKKRAKILLPSSEGLLDIFFCTPDNYITMKFMLDSPRSYNIRIRRVAKLRGYKLSQNGLFKNDTKINIQSEHELCKLLVITHRIPKERY